MVSVICAGAFRPLRAAGAAGTANREAPVGRRFAGIFSDPEAARSIGRRYLAAHPEEAAGARLLAEELGRRPRLPPPGAEELRRALADRRRRDFEDGAVVVVGGWVLARTEARACALTVL